MSKPDILKQEMKRYSERPKFGVELLRKIEPSLKPFRENPKTSEYISGIEAAVMMLGDDFLPIPRPSGKEQEITAHWKTKAEGIGWYAEVDRYDNLGMVIPATPGYEDYPAILGHFHTDIVPAAGKNAITNPEIDPVEPAVIEINGKQWVVAKDDRTLGSDDGGGAVDVIQACMDMASEKDTDDKPIPHGPILLFGTSREEVGLEGMEEFVAENAFNPEGEFAKYLPKVARILNSDGEQADRLTIGSLGGERYEGKLQVAYEPLPGGYELVEIKLDDFRGGHSGKYAANPSAIPVLSEMLSTIKDADIRIASLSTRNKFDNALAQNAQAVVAIPVSERGRLLEVLTEQGELLRQRYEDDPLTFSLGQPTASLNDVMTKDSSEKTLMLLSGLSELQGVESASKVFGDLLLERSMNTGVVKTEGNDVYFLAFGRIRKPDLFGKYSDALRHLASLTGAVIKEKPAIGVWEPNFARMEDYVKLQALYKDTFGIEPRLEFAPGGMEMTYFDQIYPDVLKVSNGVTIVDAHKAGERMLAKSLAELYIWNRKILAMWRDEISTDQTTQSSTRRVNK